MCFFLNKCSNNCENISLFFKENVQSKSGVTMNEGGLCSKSLMHTCNMCYDKLFETCEMTCRSGRAGMISGRDI